MNRALILAVVFAVAGVLSIVFGGWYIWKMDVLNGEIGLSVRYEAQSSVVEAKLFEARSVIKNNHACTEEWADKFIKVVAMQASGRGGNRAVLPESNGATVAGVAVASAGTSLQIGRESEALGIPQEVYLRLANTVEGKIADFTSQQITLLDIWNQHKAYCQNTYHNQFGVHLIGKVKPAPEMITSEETKGAVRTKKMDEKLF